MRRRTIASTVLSAPAATVIGVGEHCHGDLLSWAVRLEVARALVQRAGRRLVVLTENIDFNVAGLRRKTPRWKRGGDGDDGGEFHPFLVHLSNRLPAHMDAARELSRLAEGRVYGVDVQALEHPHLPGGRYVRSKMRGMTPPRGDGTLRNRQNAEIVLSIARDFSRRDPNTVVMYLAQNEHVALDCSACRGGGYTTEGALLRQALGPGGYTSIATYARNLGSFWNEERTWRVRRERSRNAPPSRVLLRGAPWTILQKKQKPVYTLGGGEYTTAHFDYTVATNAA